MNKLVFIIGMRRSGTSLLRRLVETCPDVHKIEFEQQPKVLYLDSTEVSEINEQVRKRYSLPALENLNLPQ